LPLWIVPLPWPCSNEIYEARMAEACKRAIDEHVDAIASGDLFLQDIRAYRETKLKPTGLEPLFPLWEIPADALARKMIAGGLRTKLTCVNPKQLAASFARRNFDDDLLRDFTAANRSLRRMRRVLYMRLCRAHVYRAAGLGGGGSGDSRGVRLRGFSVARALADLQTC
jgi:hypothetical protein